MPLSLRISSIFLGVCGRLSTAYLRVQNCNLGPHQAKFAIPEALFQNSAFESGTARMNLTSKFSAQDSTSFLFPLGLRCASK